MERTVLHNDRFAVAMPRGSGKTTLCEVAVIWAALTGLHSFVFLIAATEDHSAAMMTNIKAHITSNRILAEDFPDALFPFRTLEGESRKATGQRYYGVRTHIRWDEDKIVFASIPGCRSSGTIIKCTSLGSAFRGAKVNRPTDGHALRPTLAIIDDPQTDKSAKSQTQVRERLGIINGAISGLPGPQKTIGIIVPCTVINQNDVADQLLDREKNPLWQGIRTKLVNAFPTNEKLWAEYRRIREQSFRIGHQGEEANEFYLKHRAEMDEGASLAWPERHPGCISALQFAMHLRFDSESKFFAEYQNEPISDRLVQDDILTADEIVEKTNGLKHCVVPLNANTVTAFIDVQQKALFYVVAAFGENFTSAVIDYGVYPEQHSPYFKLSNLSRTIAMVHPSGGIEAALTASLNVLAERLLSREWEREDGAMLRINRCLVDSGWGAHTELVYEFCRRSPHAVTLFPSKGRSVTCSLKPIDEWDPVVGMKTGPGWAIRQIPNMPRSRLLHYDTNKWKSFAHARLATPLGDNGSLSLFGHDPERHVLFSEHLTAEYRDRKTSERTGRTVDEWHLPPNSPDNHWLDGLVGACVAGSIEGITMAGSLPRQPERRIVVLPARRMAR